MGNLLVHDEFLDYKQFMKPLNFDECKQLYYQISTLDKIYLGYPYRVWLQCCYKKYGSFITGNNSDYVEALVDFSFVEYTVMNGFVDGEEWSLLPMMIIYNMLESPKHRRIIGSVLKDPKISDTFKDNVNNYLLNIIV